MDTPGANSGAIHGWAAVVLGLGMAVALRGDGQAAGGIIAGVGFAIVVFAGATRPLERAVGESAGSWRGLLGLIMLCALIIVGLLAIVGAGAGMAGVLP